MIISPGSFIGDYHLDCDYGVAWFNGEEGSVVSLKDSESPIGYELVSVNAKKVTIRTVLDNCRMQELPPRCFTHDLATGSEEPAACPPRTKPKKYFRKVRRKPVKSVKKQ